MDIAIVGIGARLPGDDSTPEGFWDLLVKARSAQSEAPKSRYNARAFYHPDPDRAGSTPVTTGHFLKQDPGAFDAPFFSITPAEAKAIDPQQRLLLEVTYEALENAGLRIDDLKGSKTSCYAGNFTGDYRDLTMHDNEGHGLYTATGTHTSLVANRVSWFFDLAGPSVTMDTACSASLTAFHLACQGIRNGEADMSLVAGTHLILGPDSTLLLSAGRILSPQGTSKAFDHRADGYGRGEGVGVVVLKPLHAALRDKDTIRAVVLGSAANHNGRTPSPSQPSSAAQMALIRAAYEQAGIPPSRCGFVEAHGTGTAVGDPLETAAIAETLGKDRTSDLYVGSSKTNIGHLESAAGMAGLIKCILVVEKGVIPPNIWFEKLNPRIHLPDHVKIPTTPVPWPDNGARIASVNSFGFGGANAHVIIQDAYHFLRERGLFGLHQTDIQPKLPETTVPNGINGHTNGHTNGVNGHSNGTSATNGHTNGHTNGSNGVNGASSKPPAHPKLLVLSAQDKQGTERLSKQLAAYLARKRGQHQNDDDDEEENARVLDNLAYTLSRRRSRLLWKTFLLAPSLSAAQAGLSGGPPLRGATRSSRAPRLAFVFTGQGAQWHAMGRSLFAHYATFRRSVAACDDVLAALGCPWRIRDELFRDERDTRVNEAQVSQPVCVALQTALVDLLAHDFGLRPHAVVGHSSGEMGAAYGAGVLSRRAAVALAWHRGVYAAKVEEARDLDGTMLAVRAGGDAVLPWLEKLGKGARGGMAVVGCFNSPQNCTVSGDRTALEKLRVALEAEGIGSTPLRVGVAYHSPHMRRIAAEYEEAIAEAVKGETPPSSASGVPFFSSVTGKLLPPAELGPSYWVRNLVSSVNFTGGVQAMLRSAREGEDGSSGAPFVDAFVEVGPHSALKTYLAEICAGESAPLSIPYTTLLRRKTDAVETLMTAMGELWCLGADVDLARVNLADPGARMLTDLPPYPFNHSSSYWAESALTRQYRFREHPRSDHLGVRFAGAVTPQWRNFLKLRENPWLEHSKVNSEIVYPRAGFVVMAIEAMQQLADLNEEPIVAFELRDIAFSATELRIPSEDRSVEVMTQVQPPSSKATASSSSSWADFTIVSRSAADEDWQPQCHGKIRAVRSSALNTPTAQTEARWEHKRLAEAHNGALTACTRPFPAFYEALATSGAASSREYGPVFRSLRGVHLGDGCGRAIARVPDTASTMPHGFEYGARIIHPAALDALLAQMLAPALMRPGDALADMLPAAPVAVDRLYVAAEVGVGSPGKEFDVFSKAEREAGRKVSVYALQAASSVPAVIVEGVRVEVNGRKEEGEAGGSSSSLCLKTAWREDVDLLTAPQATRAILERAEPDAFDGAHYAMLDLVALPYIRDAVEWLARDGKPYEVPEEADFLRLFHAWMVDKLREKAALEADLATLQARADAAVGELVKSEAGVVTVELIRRVGENLRGIMTREVEPLQVMLEGGLLYEYYRVGLGTSFNSNVAEYMGLLAHKGAGQLRILEVGGGTGGTTRRILDAIRDDTGVSKVAKYVFTDVSPGFLGNAATNFARDAAVLDFRTLNIEEDPLAQGFEAESFDVLVCANVLHATHRIRDTLRRCRALLKPRVGRLVLAELTENPVFMGLMMGPLPGWWLGEEDGRHGGPIMTAADWDAALKDAGFTGVDLHVRGDRNSGEGSPTALIVSTRDDNDDEQPAVKKSAVCLLVEDGSEAKVCAGALQSLLADRGEKASILPWATLSPSAVRGSYCVCLVGLQKPSTIDLSADEVAKVNDLLASAAAVCWVTKNGSPHPLTSLITGTARSEGDSDAKEVITVSLDQVNDTASVDRLAELVLRHQLSNNQTPHDTEYTISNGIVRIPRVTEAAPLNGALAAAQNKADAQPVVLSQTTAPLTLAIGTPGQLDTLHFVHADASYSSSTLPAGWIEIEVVAAGVNARDVAVAAGTIEDQDGDGALGLECSGTVARVGDGVATFRKGDRVAALARGGALAKYVRVPAGMALPLPLRAGLAFEDAAAFVLAYATAYHALVQVARLQRGESVLIHAAAGAVGQAAIVLAQRRGAEVFVTVGSEEKRRLLVEEYGVPGDRVFGSRDQAFAKGVVRMTGGRGVDVVLNSLAGESRRLSWHCLSDFGRFLEIGGTEAGLEALPLLKNRSYFGIDMYELIKKPNKVIASIMDGVSELLQSGAVKVAKPLSVYGAGKIETVFAYMRTGEHMGKTVIKMSTDDQVMYTPSPPRINLHQDATYVFAGSLAGADRELARWLISRGARQLVFLSGSAANHKTDEAYARSLSAEHDGLQAAAIICDVADKASVNKALQSIQGSLPPIKGVIVGAMVTEENDESQAQPAKQFSAATARQMRISYNLHDALSASALDFFVLLSSGHSALGLAAFHDTLAQQQQYHSSGRTLSVSLGLVGDNTNSGLREAPRLRDVETAIEAALLSEQKSNNATAITIISLPAASASTATTTTPLRSPRLGALQRRLDLLAHASSTTAANDATSASTETLSAALTRLAANPPPSSSSDNNNNTDDSTTSAAASVVTQHLRARLARLMLVPAEEVDPQRPLGAYGVDSLVAAELRNWLRAETGVDVGVARLTGADVPIARVAWDVARERAKGKKE